MGRFRIVWLALIMAAGTSVADAAPPNIVMIVGDDQGWTDFSFMGHAHIRTPNIDRLAREGLTFRRGYVPSSLCRPSLASMITGLYAHQHRIACNDPPLPIGKTGAAANQDATFLAQRQDMIANIERVPTLPRMLRERGYVSFQSGKWWEGSFSRGGFTDGMTHGDSKRSGRHGDEGLKIGRQGMVPVLDFIDSAGNDQKPFFVWYAPMMPHTPHTPPQRLLEKYQKLTDNEFVAKYWTMCEWFDETVGELVDHLDRRKLADNTLVVFLCDNGWIQDESAGVFAPKSKRSPYDGGLRTPIILRWPGRIAARQSDANVLSIDIAPTLLTAAGLLPEKEMPGVNLLDQAAVNGRSAIFGEVFEHNAVDIDSPASSLQYRWAVAGQWKLIRPALPRVPKGSVELYDLSRDPREETNVARQQPAEVARLTKLLDAWWPGTP